MSPNSEPRWVDQEPVSTADAEFNEALQQSPFVGAIAMEALAKFIKATETARTMRRRHVSPEAATEVVISRIAQARDAAVAAPDPTYAQLFDAQLQGWEAAGRTIQAQPAPQEAPTQTAKKSMSGGKSKRS